MANREQPDAAEETFPGPGPLRADEAKRSIHPVEQMMDAAIDRIAREQEASRDAGQRSSAARATEAGKANANAQLGQALALHPVDVDEAPGALATMNSARRARSRLRWKGLEVSDEFRRYADRVARGEDLPPFQGKILAEPDPAFPWDQAQRHQAERRARRQQVGLWTGVALFLGACIWVLVVQVGKSDDARNGAESPLATVVLSNQPPASQLEVAGQDPAAAAELAATPQPSETESGSIPSPAQGTTALASLHDEHAAPAAAASPPHVAVPSSTPSTGSPVSAGTATASSVATPRTPAPAGASASIGTNAPASSLATSDGATASAGAVSPGNPSGNTPAGNSAAASSPAANSPAANSPAANAPPVAASSAAGSGPTSPPDSKKETGREASGMGPLLVETPSF